MKKYKRHITIQSIFILSILLSSNEAKRISKEKLARLLSQNPGVGFHQKKTIREETSPKSKKQYFDVFGVEGFLLHHN